MNSSHQGRTYAHGILWSESRFIEQLGRHILPQTENMTVSVVQLSFAATHFPSCAYCSEEIDA